MARRGKVKLETKELDAILSNINQVKGYEAVVGVINNKEQIEKALIHELGSRVHNIPKRSFIKDPLMFLAESIKNYMAKSMQDFILKPKEKGNALQLMNRIGLFAESIIKDAFKDGFGGKWRALSPFTIMKKGHDKILIETGKLLRSVTSLGRRKK